MDRKKVAKKADNPLRERNSNRRPRNNNNLQRHNTFNNFESQRKPHEINQHITRSRTTRNTEQAMRPFHKDYDPNIELRQVQDRMRKRKQDDWGSQTLILDDEENDLNRYMKKKENKISLDKIEQDLEVLNRRQRDIDIGKSVACYQKYVYKISKELREPYMPVTPNKFVKMSRRCWDGSIRKWKKHIHAYEVENFKDLYKAGFTIDCCRSETTSISSIRDALSDALGDDDRGSVADMSNRLAELEDEEEDNTMQGNTVLKTDKNPTGSSILRKRPNTDTMTGYDENTLESKPTVTDLHTGLTQDAFDISITSKKKRIVEFSSTKH